MSSVSTTRSQGRSGLKTYQNISKQPLDQCVTCCHLVVPVSSCKRATSIIVGFTDLIMNDPDKLGWADDWPGLVAGDLLPPHLEREEGGAEGSGCWLRCELRHCDCHCIIQEGGRGLIDHLDNPGILDKLFIIQFPILPFINV